MSSAANTWTGPERIREREREVMMGARETERARGLAAVVVVRPLG
jgi:hypothetical protein